MTEQGRINRKVKGRSNPNAAIRGDWLGSLHYKVNMNDYQKRSGFISKWHVTVYPALGSSQAHNCGPSPHRAHLVLPQKSPELPEGVTQHATQVGRETLMDAVGDDGDHQSTHRGDMSACSCHGRDAEDHTLFRTLVA